MRGRMGTSWLMRCSFSQCSSKGLELASGDRGKKRGVLFGNNTRIERFCFIRNTFPCLRVSVSGVFACRNA
jgi:hypothetical protein